MFGVAPVIDLTTEGGDPIDWSGLESMSIRINMGAADELTIDMTAQDMDGNWRPDMPIWQVGASMSVFMGYDASMDLVQSFEIVSTTNQYPESGHPTMTVRGVSQLARSARNGDPRVFDGKDDTAILNAICSEYGWNNGVDSSLLLNRIHRMKKAGTSDLSMLKQIAKEARLGGPRVTYDGTLLMQEPDASGAITFSRGSSLDEDGWGRVWSFSPNREGGHTNVQLVVTSWDPSSRMFIETVFQADEFNNDPKIVFEGPASIESIPKDSSTRGLVLQVVEARGENFSSKVSTSSVVVGRSSGRTSGGKVRELTDADIQRRQKSKGAHKASKPKPVPASERRDVLSVSRYMDETDALDLARRWFKLREQLSRWATIEVDGTVDLEPYKAIKVVGDMAKMDSGLWLPTVLEHSLSSDGWKCRVTAIRIADEGTIKSVS